MTVDGQLVEVDPVLDPEGGAVDELGAEVALSPQGAVLTSPLREAAELGDVGAAIAVERVCPE